jgi:hypothetical protein
MRSIRQSLQAQPKIIKKLSDHQISNINIRTNIFAKKKMFGKRKGAKNWCEDFAGSTQNLLSEHQINQLKLQRITFILKLQLIILKFVKCVELIILYKIASLKPTLWTC